MKGSPASRLRLDLNTRESDSMLGDIVDFLPDATFVINSDNEVITWNRAIEELTGVPAAAMIGKKDYEYALPFYGERRPLLIDLCSEPDEIVRKYYSPFTRVNDRLTAEDHVPGTIRRGAYIWAMAQPLRDRNGRMIGAIESLRDVTDRKHSEEKFATVFKLSPYILSISTVSDGRYVEVSDRFYAVSGYTREEIIGHTAFEINIWADARDRERVLGMLRATGSVANEEIRFRMKNGEIRYMLFSAGVIHISGVPHLLVVNVDITDRKVAQETIERQNAALAASNEQLTRSQSDLMVAHELLRQSEEKVSSAFHIAPVLMTLTRLSDGRYVEASDYFLRSMELPREQVIGHTRAELGNWVDPAHCERIMQRAQAGERIVDEEIVLRSKSGKCFTMLYSCETIRLFDVPHVVGVAIDITEKRRSEHEKRLLEEQLRQAQKMESIGRLAGGVAHDFNNLLTAILGNADLAQMSLDARQEVAERLDLIRKAATSASQLTRHLLAFSRRETIEPTVLDVNALIDHERAILARLIGENIKLMINPEAHGRIKADPAQVEQAIMNITVNARDAMPDGGTLILGTEDVVLDEHYCKAHAGARPGRYVMIAMSDTGHGMDEETKKSIFEPFFTTKGRGKGTGLGLAVVYGAVTQNGGLIDVYSVPGEGTTFKIYFPRTDEPGGGQLRAAETVIAPQGRETILLVEDDELVRDFASEVLARLGYRVIAKPSGEEALAFAESSAERIDLLLTDVILTGINGKTLAVTLSSRIPDLKILFSSGYPADIIAQRGILDRGINFIGKPYASLSLAQKVRETLDAR